MAKNLSRKITIYIDGKPAEASLEQLQDRLRKLNNEQQRLPIGTQEYIDKSKEIGKIRQILHDQKVAVNNLGDNWLYASEKLANFSNVIMGIQTIFQMADAGIGKLKDLVADAAELDDAYADVMKTTGLTRDEVLKLNESFKKMDTRTAREQLNQLAYEAGKLGINSTQQVEQFVRAADKINIALGDVLGEGAMVTIGKLADVYSKSTAQLTAAGDDLEKKMLSIGSAVNQLGQSSTANEGYLVEFLSRMGGIATQANLSADAILGFASALDQDMMKQEMSATAFQKFIMQLIKKPAEFAAAAHMEVKEFSDLMQRDMNEALLRVLEGFKGQGGLVSLQPIFEDLGLDAARAASVISSMANSIDQIREAQAIANDELTTGSSIIREFTTKNNTMQAQAEKAKKAFQDMRLELGEQLYPIVIHLTRLSTSVIKGLSGYLTLWRENRVAAAALTTATVTLVGWITRHRIATLASNAATAIKNKLDNLARISTLRKAAATAKAKEAEEAARLAYFKSRLEEEKKILADRSYQLSEAGLQRQTIAATEAQRWQTLVTKQQTVATEASSAAAKAHRAALLSIPWGIIIAALTTVTALAVKAYRNSEGFKISKAIKDAGHQAAEAQGKLRVLRDRLEESKIGTEQYKQALDELKELYPDIIAKHIDEEGHIRDLAKAYQELSAAARQSAMDRVFAEKTEEAYADLADVVSDSMDKIRLHLKANHGNTVSEAEWDEVFKKINIEVGKVADGTHTWEEAMKRVKNMYDEYGIHGTHKSLFGDPVNSSVDIAKALKTVQEQYEKTEHIIARYSKKLNQAGQEESQATFSSLENARKRKDAVEAEISVLKKRMELLSKRIGNGYDGQAQYEQMKNRLYDLEATARGTANEIANIEKALSGMSVEQMKIRAEAVKQEIATLQYKMHVMGSVAFVDFLTKKGLEDNQAKIEQLNREWQTLSQEIEKAEAAAAKAASGDAPTIASGNAEKDLKKWQQVKEQAERLISDFNAKAQTGLSKTLAEIENRSASLRRDIEDSVGATRQQKDALIAQVNEAEAAYKQTKIDEYIKKLTTEAEKFAKSNTSNEKLKQVRDAAARLARQLAEIDNQINAINDDLQRKDISDSQRQQLEALIQQYAAARQQLSASAFRGIDTAVDTSSFSLSGDAAKDARAYATLTGQIRNARQATEELRNLTTNPDLRNEYEAQLTDLEEQQRTLDEIFSGAEQFANKVRKGKLLDNLISNLQFFGDQALDILGNIFQIVNNIGQRELREAEQLKDRNIANLDDQLAHGLISQEQYDNRKTKLEEDYQAKQKEIELEAWRREKLLNSSQAAMAGALAILRVWSDAGNGPTAMRAVQTAIVGAATLAQIAAIADEPEPYARGGYVRDKKIMVGEAGSEWIASHRLLSDPVTAPVIAALDSYQRFPAMAAVNMPAVNQVSQQRSESSRINAALLAEMRRLADYLSDPANRRAVISRRTQETFDANENFLRNAARL